MPVGGSCSVGSALGVLAYESRGVWEAMSSKPWWRDARVDETVMTTWRRKEVFLCAFGLVHILKRQCGWMLIFLFYTASERVLEELFLEIFSFIENFLPCPPGMNGFSWVCFISRFQSSFGFLPPVTTYLLCVTFLGTTSVNSTVQAGSLFQLHALYFKLG